MPTIKLTETPELSAEQQEAVEQLLSFPNTIQTLGGYAGTGKSTVVKQLKQQLPNFAVCAFTGKAAHVLRRKGVAAKTIHSLIYTPKDEEYRDAKGKLRTRIVFRIKPQCLLEADGIIVDESSMVGQAIYDDLASFGVPLIFIGDHGQLEPVKDHSFNLMESPDITLETVHRNAGEIAHFADFIRKGNTPANWRRHKNYTGTKVHFLKLQEAVEYKEQIIAYHAIICAFNDTRITINRQVREDQGYPADRPVVGDRVMCLQNDHDAGVFNGQQGVVDGIFGDEMVFTSDDEPYRVRFNPDQFNQPKKFEDRDKHGRLPFDYAYAITCHKAQGDEFNNVLVLEQKCRLWDHKRWAYTAASRARQQLSWVEL